MTCSQVASATPAATSATTPEPTAPARSSDAALPGRTASEATKAATMTPTTASAGGAVQVGGGQAEVQAEVDPVQDQHHEGRDRGHGQEAQRQEWSPPRGAQEREQRRRRIRHRTFGRPGVGTDGEGDLGGGHGQPASNVRVPPSRRMQLQSGS